MKILHINTSDDQSGAYLAMWNLHQACLQLGFDSRILLLNRKNAEKPGQYSYWEYIGENFREKVTLFLRRRILYKKMARKEAQLAGRGKPFHFYRTPYRIHRHPLVREADIIHLHQVSGMLDWPSFFPALQDQKLFFTLHDCEPFSEGFHLDTGITEADRIPYRHLPAEKKRILDRWGRGTAIFPSQWHQQRARHNAVFSAWKQLCLPHIIHSRELKPMPRNEAAQKLGLDPGQHYLAFVISDLSRPAKGYNYLYARREQIQQAGYRVIVSGSPGQAPRYHNWHYTGLIQDPGQLAAVYALASYTLQCSTEESFGLTVVESLLCGTPVISRPIGIAADKSLFPGGLFVAGNTSDESLDALLRERLYADKNEPFTLNEKDWNRPILEKISALYTHGQT